MKNLFKDKTLGWIINGPNISVFLPKTVGEINNDQEELIEALSKSNTVKDQFIIVPIFSQHSNFYERTNEICLN